MLPPDEESPQWSLCCSISSAQFVKFAITGIFCFSTLLFSMIMIIRRPNEDNAIYFSLISSILSLYMSPPALHEEKPQVQQINQNP